MSDESPIPTRSEPRRLPIRMPHWGWFALATIVLVVGFVGLTVWLPYHREQQAIQKIEGWGGRFETRAFGPDWLRKFVKDDALKEFKVFDRITSLGLSGTENPDAELAELRELKNVEFVVLNLSAVTEAGLAHLSRHTKIETLHLNETAVTDTSLVHLSRLKNLTALHLSQTRVTDAGLAHLSVLTKLEFLNLSGTAVTDAGLRHLTGLTSLTHLDLCATQVTDKAIGEFQKALPGCSIIMFRR